MMKVTNVKDELQEKMKIKEISVVDLQTILDYKNILNLTKELEETVEKIAEYLKYLESAGKKGFKKQ